MGKTWAALFAASILVAVAWGARQTVAPVVAAGLAAFILEPAVATIARRRSRRAAALLLTIGVLLALIVIPVALAPVAVREAGEAGKFIVERIPLIQEKLTQMFDALPVQARDAVAASIGSAGKLVLNSMLAAAGKSSALLAGISGAVTAAAIFVLALYAFMLNYPLIRPGILELLPGAWRGEAAGFLKETAVAFREFFRGQISLCLAIGALSAIGLACAGLPYGLTVGMFSGMLTLIPYLGVAAGLSAALTISWFAFHSWAHLAVVAAIFGAIQALDTVLLTPKLVGERVGLSPAVAAVSLLVFSELLGFFGLLLAIPLAAMTLSLLRRLHSHAVES